VEENERGFLVKTEDGKSAVRWIVDREGKIIPEKLEPAFNV